MLATASRLAMPLGPALRPIVFGAAAPGRGLALRKGKPELVLSVHGPDDDLLGYAVLDRRGGGPALGGLTVVEESPLHRACLLARSTTLQLALHRVSRGSHHCVVAAGEGTDRERAERKGTFLRAVEPLVLAGVLDIGYRENGTRHGDGLADRALAASLAETLKAVLEHLGVPAPEAKIALGLPPRDARRLAAALGEEGLTAGAGAVELGERPDVLVLGDAVTRVGQREAMALDARCVVALAATELLATGERQLRGRGVLYVPETLAASGRALALHLSATGLEGAAVLSQVASRVAERARELLSAAAAAEETLAAAVRREVVRGSRAAAASH
jgi:glutamate dehydrogenase/leucine dehydrogenase